MTGRALQRARERLFSRSPLCVVCEREGRITRATQRDHRVPLCDGGTDTDDNVQALCDACHQAKSLAEALRARVGTPGRLLG